MAVIPAPVGVAFVPPSSFIESPLLNPAASAAINILFITVAVSREPSVARNLDKFVHSGWNIIDVNIEKDDLTKFRMYFGYDTFNILHNVLCSLINNKTVNDNNYKLLFEEKSKSKSKK